MQGEFASASLSDRLTSYPQDLLNSPLDIREVEVEITSVGLPPKAASDTAAPQSASGITDRNDAFTRLILLDEITVPVLLLALGISFAWGAAHAMTPGHGKTIVGAYLVGSRGTLKHAFCLGLTTTITHTLGVFALGLVTLFAAQYIVPERLYPWLSLLSGLFVVGIGMNLFLERIKSSGLAGRIRTWMLGSSPEQQAFSLAAARDAGDRFALAAPRSRLHTGHHHGHEHPHPHVHDHDHDRRPDHSHDHADHSHTPPETVTWRSLLALGVSGGLIPCPSALVVMLGAIALDRIGLGLVLVLAFSLGLAGALTAIGMLFIYAGSLFKRFPSSGRLIGFLPVLSALFISVIGLGIALKAAMEIGI
jgi:ABC-type nickel/cobalt efflux system permease component RcnA